MSEIKLKDLTEEQLKELQDEVKELRLRSEQAEEQATVQAAATKAQEVEAEEKEEVTFKMPKTAESVQLLGRYVPPPPSLPIFSGHPVKGETDFETWEYSIKSILFEGVHSEVTVKQALRKSLRGEAAQVMRAQPFEVTVDDLIVKLKDAYGSVTSGQSAWQQFYGSAQSKDESVVTWMARLEGLLAKATKGKDSEENDERLRNQLWQKLRDQKVKESSRHKYDEGISCQGLFKYIRGVEESMDNTGIKRTAAMEPAGTEVKGQAARIQELEDKIANLLKPQYQAPSQQYQHWDSNRFPSQQFQRWEPSRPPPHQYQQWGSSRPPAPRGQFRGQGRGWPRPN